MTSAAALGLSDHQFSNLNGIVAAVKARGWSNKAAYIAVEAALAESGMRMIASANVPASVQYPHDLLSWTYDGLGHDHASCGMFQQQCGYVDSVPGTSTMGSPYGWGRPAELMNAKLSTAKFLDALSRHPWAGMTNWAAAQSVQGSAFADGSNYRAQDARARYYVDAVWSAVAKPAPTPAKPAAPAPKATGHHTVRAGETLSSIAAACGTTWQVLQRLNNLANPNVIRIGQVLAVTGTKVAAAPAPKPAPKVTTRVVGTYTVRAGDTLTAICRRYPQAWITPASVAHLNGLSSPDHIVIGQVLRIGG